jgi:small ligand-binding sensory domain FIST
MAVMTTDLDEEAFRVMAPIRGSADDFLAATRAWRERTMASVAVVHGDPTAMQLTESIASLADGLDHGFLVGGLTSSPGGLQLQIADRAVDGGLSGVLLAGSVSLATGLSQGCSLIGRPHVVTECRRNIAIRIDDRPALDVLKEDIGDILARNLERIGGYIFAALPVPASDTGDYLVRNLIGIDPDSGLVAIGDRLGEGTRIQFARRDPDSARADLERMVKAVLERVRGTAKGALYHTCIGRGRHQFGDDSAELQLVREHLGDVPLVGFYANGEISHHLLYGYTGVLTVFHDG